MSEHAFDPIPDEQQERVAVAEDAKPLPNAVVTVKQVREAIKAGRWSHEVPGTELWLNTSFPPVGDVAALCGVLAAYGIAVE